MPSTSSAGTADRADAIFETDLATLPRVLWNCRELSEALRAGAMRIEGDG